MLPASLAFAWALWRRHSRGLLVVLAYLLIAVTMSAVLPAHFAPQVAAKIFGPLMLAMPSVFLYLVAVFSYGMDPHDVIARGSCFPAGLFTLPVRTGALVGWPIVYGAAAAALLWQITTCLILGPWLRVLGETVPLWWPAMLAVAFLAWVQAMLWSPFGLRGLRIALLVILIPGNCALPQLCLSSGASEGFLAGLLAALAAAGWTVSYVGVRRARCGDVPNWEGPLHRLAYWPPPRRQPFTSAARAQVWFEWRRSGNSLPIMTGLLLPFALLFLAFGKNDVLSTAQTLLSSLAIPVYFASQAGVTVRPNNTRDKENYGLAPFTATLPIDTAALVGARLKTAALSTLAAWAVMAVAVPLAVVLTGNLEEVMGWWRHGLDEHHPAKVIAGMVAAATLLVVWTWKRHVDSVFAGLPGQAWIAVIFLLVGLLGPLSLGWLVAWIYNTPATHDTILAVLPWLLGLVVLCRLLAAGWALRNVLRQELLATRTVARWATAWLVLASALFGVVAWIVPPTLVPWYYLAFGVVWCLPMARLAATPLALAWNRHR